MPRANGATAKSLTTQETIFDADTDGGPCTTFAIRVRSDSAASALVNIPQLHGAAKVLLVAGQIEHFRFGGSQPGSRVPGIAEVKAEGSGGTATIDYWVAAAGV